MGGILGYVELSVEIEDGERSYLEFVVGVCWSWLLSIGVFFCFGWFWVGIIGLFGLVVLVCFGWWDSFRI